MGANGSIGYVTNENEMPRKTVTYKAHLPLHPRDWTVETFRQFVKDADSQGISGDTHVKRFPENDPWAFQTDQNLYYGLGVERVEVAADDEPVAEYPKARCHNGSCTTPCDGSTDSRDKVEYRDSPPPPPCYGA